MITHLSLPGLLFSGTAEMKDIRSLRPKNLETKRVAFPWACGLSIHSKHGLRMHWSLHPLLKTLQPLQLMILEEMENAFSYTYSFSSGIS